MIFFESDWIIISTVGENKSHVPNHQPAIIGGEMSMVIDKLYICNVLRYVLNRCNHGDYQMVNY